MFLRVVGLGAWPESSHLADFIHDEPGGQTLSSPLGVDKSDLMKSQMADG